MKLKTILLMTLLASGLAFIKKPKPVPPTVGAAVPDFTLPDTDGKMVSLANFPDAKGFIVIFISGGCDISEGYESSLNRFNKWYAKKGYPVIAINCGDTAMDKKGENGMAALKEKAKKKGFSFPYLWDPQQTVAKQYQVERTPYAFVITKEDGKYTSRYIGAIDGGDVAGGTQQDRYLADAVDALLAGKSPDYMVTNAMGCPMLSHDKK